MSNYLDRLRLMETGTPTISASFGLNPTTYAVSTDEAPYLTLTIISSYTHSITIFADDLSPRLITQTGCTLVITGLTDNTDVKQTTRTHCRIPLPRKVAVPFDESLFYILLPGQPLIPLAPFTGSSKSRSPNGVDGLKPGQRYVITLSGSQRFQWNRIRWWEYGTKEELLAKGLDGREVRYGRGPHEPIEIDISGIQGNPIYLDCRH
ncbi:hypothetical protein F5Y09DRAFT_352360 [Xylaria sp. FL1042]|nr:hypothetical protein F5Y09DRAFT_352360 [Xylaria sp. FL1042]